jgi:acetamidase/formamidase
VSARHTLKASVRTVHRGIFDAGLPPVLAVESGDIVEVTSLSGNSEDLPGLSSGFNVLPEHQAVLAGTTPGEGPHFMTGPIAVRGALPGDELVVEIMAVALLQDWGWNLIAPQKGTLPEQFPQMRRIHVGIDRARGIVTLPWGLQLPAAPFFGIVGVAPPPEMGRVTRGTLHLPVFNKGALLSVGDGHAIQGDGEVCLTAIETALSGTLRVTLKKDTGIARPWAETPSHVITMAFDPDLDIAAQSAVHEMVRLIERTSGLSAADAYTLCSVAADVHVTQLVNVHKGVHVMLRKDTLRRA